MAGILSNWGEKAKDALAIGAVLTILLSSLGTGVALLTRELWEPFVNLPGEVGILRVEVGRLESPKVLNVKGNGLVLDDRESYPGGTVLIGYTLRREISCDTLIIPEFVNVDTGVRYSETSFPSSKAPVTDDLIWFTVPISIPDSLPYGRYIYLPTIVPLDCGVYESFRIPSSEIFTVRPNES